MRSSWFSRKRTAGWHRAGFRLYWRLWSPGGGRRIEGEVLEIVRRMARENPSWGAPKIHGEMLKLGFRIPERTLSRYLARRLPRSDDAAKNWLAFLRNHREVIAALDFFTVPTVTFRLLYCFFVIDHGRRKILQFNVTSHPTAEWVVQQLREAFPDSVRHRYAILDRHVRRIAREYAAYYHRDRTHDGLGKDTPDTRAIGPKPAETAELVSLPRVGGLHHRYVWKRAA